MCYYFYFSYVDVLGNLVDKEIVLKQSMNIYSFSEHPILNAFNKSLERHHGYSFF